MSAKVFIIGAGPGDQGLITLRAVECLRKSNLVIYEETVNVQLLEFSPPDGERIYLENSDDLLIPQDELFQIIRKKLRADESVSILLSGDPFTEGKGGEISKILFAKGIPFEIIPGISSAAGAPAYSGIPLICDTVSSSVHIIFDNPKVRKLNYRILAELEGTLVFIMKTKEIDKVASALLINNKNPKTPIAIIKKGTLAEQETLVSTLDEIGKDITLDSEEDNINCTAVIGDVVNLRPELFWFEKKPLFKKKFIVTRSEEQGQEFVEALENLGAEVHICPTVKISPIENRSLIDKEIVRLENYTWIIFAHINAVRIFMERIFELGKDTRTLGRMKICAIGGNTGDSLIEYGIIPDVLTENFSQEAILKDLQICKGDKVLLPRAASARDLLPLKLEDMGASVEVVPLYEMVTDIAGVRKLVDLLSNQMADAVAFTSSASVLAFTNSMNETNRLKLLKDTLIASNGPITSKTLKNEGIKVDIEAKEYSSQSLIKAILEYYNVTTNF